MLAVINFLLKLLSLVLALTGWLVVLVIQGADTIEHARDLAFLSHAAFLLAAFVVLLRIAINVISEEWATIPD